MDAHVKTTSTHWTSNGTGENMNAFILRLSDPQAILENVGGKGMSFAN